MYSYIKGRVVDQTSNQIILECNQIGYEINVPNPFLYKLNEDVKVYLYENIKEDEHSLFGFRNLEEKNLFLNLIDVKGIGPRTALPMFASGSTSGIVDAIERGNVLYLKRFPKIGEKAAKQIILDLKGKVSCFNYEDTSNYGDLVDVLKGLGYKEKDINPIINKVDSNLLIEDQVKEALKLLLK